MRSLGVILLAAVVGAALSPLVNDVAAAIERRRPGSPIAFIPLIAVALFVFFAISKRGRRRRRGSAFVIMRGRINCPECSYLMDLDDKHCARCGTAVVQVKRRMQCDRCRARNWEDDKFCRQCGNAINDHRNDAPVDPPSDLVAEDNA